MAIIKRGILGGVQNKIGNVVGSSWKGIATLRSLPLSVSNPRTSGQMAQRGKFSAISKISSALLATIVKPLWDRFAQQESGYNVFVRTNISTVGPDGKLQLDEFAISKGSLAASDIISAAHNAGTNDVTVTWDTSPAGDANATDEAYLVVAVQRNLEQTFYAVSAAAARSVGTAVIEDVDISGHTAIQVYLAFRKADGSKVSNTSTSSVEV